MGRYPRPGTDRRACGGAAGRGERCGDSSRILPRYRPRLATVMSTAPPVRILALHAVPVRRLAIDLRALLESTIKVMEQQARAIEVALTVDVGPDVPQTLRLDPEKIAWTLTALIGNALRFVRRGTRLMPGGTIQVHARYARR